LSPAWIKISPGFRKRQVPRDTCVARPADEDVLQQLKSKDGQVEEESVCDVGVVGGIGISGRRLRQREMAGGVKIGHTISYR
jgi:hypothetical protein